MIDGQAVPTNRLPDPSRWLDEYGDYLFRYAVLRLRQHELAEDVVQETFLAALQQRQRFAGRSSVKSWLVSILKHKIVDALRRKGRESPASDVAASGAFLDHWFNPRGKWRIKPKDWGDPSAALEGKEFWAVFLRCLSKLPARLADAFVLRELEVQSTNQVRKALRVSAGNLWVLLHRARLRLWRCLDVNWFSNE